MSDTNSIIKCCICGKKFLGWGNDPWPVVKQDNKLCCDSCNYTVVIPARLEQLFGKVPEELDE